jgi:hypothetical protein
MNGDDENGLVKELSHPTPEGVLKLWARVIGDLKASRVCYCPGKSGGREPQFENFIGSIPFLGSNDALVYAEPGRSKEQVMEFVIASGQKLPTRIEGGCLIGLKRVDTSPLADDPDLDRKGLFVIPSTPWLPPDEQPAANRFWGDYAHLRVVVAHEQKQRHIHLLHLGIGGSAGPLYFFQPHGIPVAKISQTPI